MRELFFCPSSRFCERVKWQILVGDGIRIKEIVANGVHDLFVEVVWMSVGADGDGSSFCVTSPSPAGDNFTEVEIVNSRTRTNDDR